MSNIPLAFWLDESGLPKGAVVTKMLLTGKIARAWRLNKIQSNSWQLSFWTKIDDLPWKPDDEAIQFPGKNEKEARELAEIEAAHQLKTWESVGALNAIPTAELERWLDAWVKAHQTEWPNLFKVRKTEHNQETLKMAMIADLLAMGFEEKTTLKVLKLAYKINVSEADRLNVWLVTNWFHGKQISSRSPEERLELVRDWGLKNATVGMIKARISRLALTHRLHN